jgi:hypothetical protein
MTTRTAVILHETDVTTQTSTIMIRERQRHIEIDDVSQTESLEFLNNAIILFFRTRGPRPGSITETTRVFYRMLPAHEMQRRFSI